MITRRARAGRVTLLASIPLLALVTFAAGCGTVTTPTVGTTDVPATTQPPPSASGSPGSPASPAPVPTTTGGTITPGVAECTGWPANAARVTLPASFVPVAVLRCVTAYQMVPGKGQWLAATLERADAGLAPLTAALRRPHVERNPGVMCPELAMLPPQIVVIDGKGTQIIPRLPLGACGLVQEQVLSALAALHWQPVSVRLISQVQTPQETASGCTPQFKDPFILYGTSPKPSAGGAVYTAPPASLRICVYSAGSAATAAQFLRGTTVTGSTENVLLAGLSGARSGSLCTLPHSMFAVVQGESAGAPLVYVELGGCNRVLRYATESGGLMGISTGQATSQAVSIIEDVTHPKPVGA